MERRVPIHSTGLPCSATSHSTPSSSMEASTTTSSSSSSPRLLVFPHEQDVLLGRGKGSYEWNGNRVFARLISSHVLVYEAATGNKHKIQITQNIVALVQQMGGRFLKQVQPGTRMPSDNQNHSTTTTATNNNNSTTSDLPCCEIVSDAEARRKVSQVRPMLPFVLLFFFLFHELILLLCKLFMTGVAAPQALGSTKRAKKTPTNQPPPTTNHQNSTRRSSFATTTRGDFSCSESSRHTLGYCLSTEWRRPHEQQPPFGSVHNSPSSSSSNRPNWSTSTPGTRILFSH